MASWNALDHLPSPTYTWWQMLVRDCSRDRSRSAAAAEKRVCTVVMDLIARPVQSLQNLSRTSLFTDVSEGIDDQADTTVEVVLPVMAQHYSAWACRNSDRLQLQSPRSALLHLLVHRCLHIPVARCSH